MDKPSNERGSTGPTDGIKAEGDAGNERHICKANPAMIDDIGKKHGLEDTSENFGSVKPTLTYERGALIREEVQTFSLWPLLLNGYRYSKARGVHVQHQCSGCGS